MKTLKAMTPALRVGASTTRHNLTIFPLFADASIQLADYVPLGVALREGSARITEVSQSGSVPTLSFENLGDMPVLIIDGEELLGARQNRIANLTVLAPGKRTIPLPVSCVERGRWSYSSREFGESPDVMYHEARARKARDVSSNLSAYGSRASDQRAVWSDIDKLAAKLEFHSPTAALHDVVKSRRAVVDDYLRDIEVADTQVGAIFTINGVPAGLEIFDCPATFRTYSSKIFRSYALDSLANQASCSATATDDEASQFLDSILELDARSFPAIGLGEDLRVSSPTISGGALAHDGRVIHLAAFRTEKPRSNGRRSASGDSTRPLDIPDGHMLIRDGEGGFAILDTGSPVSIGRGSAFTIAGQTWNPSTAMEFVLDDVASHLDTRIDWLLGHDFFAANRVIIDWPRRQLHILGMNDHHAHGAVTPIELVLGVPVARVRTSDGLIRAVMDTGASPSFVPPNVVSGLTPIGHRVDFFPGFGGFETDLYRVRAEIEGRVLELTGGVLPPTVQMRFGRLLGHDSWIIGSDFFRERVIEIDYGHQRFVDLYPFE